MTGGETSFNPSKLPDSYIKKMYGLAEAVMGGRDSISYKDALSIFQKEDIDVNKARLQQIMTGDGRKSIDQGEMALLLTMMDGKLDKNGVPKFDSFIEDRKELNVSENNLMNEASLEDLQKLRERFSDYEASQAEQSTPRRQAGDFWSMPAGSRYAVFDIGAALATYSV